MASRGSTQQTAAPYNRRMVLDVIRRKGAISRKEIVDLVSLAPQTVANITQDLESVGLIVSRRQKVEKSRGQPPIAFELNPKGGYSIGISLEPGRLTAALVNLVGEVQERQSVEVETRDPRKAMEAMAQVVRQLSARASSSERLWGVGVALPGPFDHTDISFVGPTAFEGWKDLSVLDELHHATGLHVFYSVDSLAGALGESLFGVAKDLEAFFYIHFGLGLGGTLVIERSAYKGANSNATELGHIPIVPEGRPCYCGNRGCLERYVSLHALSEHVYGDGDRVLSHQEIIALIDAGDPRLEAWCREAAGHLRQAVCIIENLLDPESIIIGGGAPRRLMRRLVELAQPWSRSVRGGIAREDERIRLTERAEDSSILGAAVLPIYEMLAPRHEVLFQERRAFERVEGMLGNLSKRRAGRL